MSTSQKSGTGRRSRSKVRAASSTRSQGPKPVRQVQEVRSRSALPTQSVAVAYSQRQTFPGMRDAMRSRRIKNSELLGSVSNANSFTVTKYVVNPGLTATFPWLSVQAAQWQQYRFHSLQFRYVTRAPTSESGSVILSPDYNASDSPPSTEAQATNTMDAVEDVCWKEITCVLSPSAMFPLGPRKQIRTGNVQGDLTVYDACRFNLCVVGSSTNSIGKLWVDYDVEFYVPQTSTAVSSTAQTSFFSRSTAQTITTGVAALVDFDAATYDPLSFGNDSSGTFTPASGIYRVAFQTTFNDSAVEASTIAATFLKNGVAISPSASIQRGNNSSPNYPVVIPLMTVVSLSGTDTFAVQVTGTGAAGTLTLVAGSTALLVTPA